VFGRDRLGAGEYRFSDIANEEYVCTLGVPTPRKTIEEWKISGVYHNMFSVGDVVVPEVVLDRKTLERTVPNWAEQILDGAFEQIPEAPYARSHHLHALYDATSSSAMRPP
jgi:hypothetical protein